MTPELAAIGSFLIASLFFAVIIGRINYTNDQKDKEQRAIIFDLLQAVEDLEQRVKPFGWHMRSDGVDSVVERGRAMPQPRRGATVLPGSVLSFVDIDDIPPLKEGTE